MKGVPFTTACFFVFACVYMRYMFVCIPCVCMYMDERMGRSIKRGAGFTTACFVYVYFHVYVYIWVYKRSVFDAGQVRPAFNFAISKGGITTGTTDKRGSTAALLCHTHTTSNHLKSQCIHVHVTTTNTNPTNPIPIPPTARPYSLAIYSPRRPIPNPTPHLRLDRSTDRILTLGAAALGPGTINAWVEASNVAHANATAFIFWVGLWGSVCICVGDGRRTELGV